MSGVRLRLCCMYARAPAASVSAWQAAARRGKRDKANINYTEMIRFVEKKDIKEITALYNKYIVEGVETFETETLTEEQMADRVGHISASCPYLVAEEDGRVAGICYAHPWKERAAYCNTYETTIYLSPDFTRRGLGTALMHRLIDECRRRGYKVLIACITGCNEASIELHRKLGFSQASHFHDVGYKLGRWLDVVDFELKLD